MLQSLSIRNFVLIDRLELEFEAGLNAITGETGAGKSIVLDALNLILGGRAEVGLIRSGTEKAAIDAVFDVSESPSVAQFLESAGFEPDDGLLVISRELSQSGKSSARVCGRPATVAQLKELGDLLVDLHGQHEHQSLLAVPRHIEMLDAWGGKQVQELRARCAETYRLLRKIQQERSELDRDSRERAQLLDLYAFQSEEIARAALTPGEELDLDETARRLASSQRLTETTQRAVGALEGHEGAGALSALATAARALDEAAHLDTKLGAIATTLNNARYELEEVARDLVRYQDQIEINPERAQQVEDRLDLIRNLKRKYGATIEEIIEYGKQVGEKLFDLSHGEERAAELDKIIAEQSRALEERSGALSAVRAEVAGRFAARVRQELTDLAMEKTRFEVQLERIEPMAKGSDRCEFLLAPNPGEPLRPLARTASGGEISRVMLAIKGALASEEQLPTMVFDEIDVGVGGRTASVIGEKLSGLGKSAQILCITHLPQIASRANRHFFIEKRTDNDKTSVYLTPLTDLQRIDEIARMLGGAEITETVRQHARELLSTK